MNRIAVALGLVTASSVPALAQNYDVSWWTVDGGGTSGIAGGPYTVAATAGQPDAGGPHAGGTYVLDGGFWGGMTLYPETKCTAARAVDMIEQYSGERLWMNSACDWGVSVPLAIPYAALELRKRGHSAKAIDRLIYQNPRRFLSQCPRFNLPADRANDE